MRLEIYRAWHREKCVMYKDVKYAQIIRDHGQYYSCDGEGINGKLLDLMYDTGLVDDTGKKIITGDIISIKITGQDQSNRLVVYKDIMPNPFDRYPVIDLFPQISTPSLGIGYVLSKYVESVVVIGDQYTIGSGFGGLG